MKVQSRREQRGPALVLALILGAALAGCTDTPTPTSPAVVAPAAAVTAAATVPGATFRPTSAHQTITGWEATAQAGQATPQFAKYSAQLWTLSADLGITRLRVAVRSGVENPSGSACNQYVVVNDDADPNHINAAGFRWASLDSTMDQVVVPYRAKLTSLGKKLYLNLNYTAFNHGCTNVAAAAHQNPAEYAEFALATFQHLKTKYGLVPDSWEMILEPDNGTLFTGNGALIGKALVATASKLKAAGFVPRFVAASNMVGDSAVKYFDQLKTVTGAPQLVSELSYHRYGTPPSFGTLQAMAQRAQAYGHATAMLEKIGAGYNELIADLNTAGVTAWQQFTLAYPATDNGAQYFVANSSTGALSTGSRTRYLRQFFHYVEPGAKRVDVGLTASSGLTPVGFMNANGRAVLVVKTGGAKTFTVSGLPAGVYGMRYTTATATDAASGPDVTLGAGQVLTTSIPAAGLITVFAR